MPEPTIENLLSQMTLDEKVGQLVLGNVFKPLNWHEILLQQKEADEKGLPYTIPLELTPESLDEVRNGQIGAINSADPHLNARLQRIAVEESRLGIPLLIGHDVIHGFRSVFPIPLAESCTWDPDLLRRASQAAADEAACVGINWIFAPMVDVCREPRWGRIAEGAGEDPFLGSAMSRARVLGFQSEQLTNGARVSACPKHYVGYGAAEAGRDYNTVELSERTLRDTYLPPFKAAFDEGAGSVMSAFNEISGIPGTCNRFLLRTILREEWGWNGVVVSDFNAIGELVEHGVATDPRDAARQSILAGVDIDLESGAYKKHLAELVLSGEVPIQIVDEAVRRVLELKFSLGLFENPLPAINEGSRVILSDGYRGLALEVAERSMVLLKNDGALPLPSAGKKIALIGPMADNRADMLGTWAITGQAADCDTLRAALTEQLGEENVLYAKGCSIKGMHDLDLADVFAAVQTADVVVFALGEGADMSGEAHSRVHLTLPGRQRQLFDAVAATGKPIITVLMSGRPLVVGPLAERSNALLSAWHGGIRVGTAAANILLGVTNPSGKLTASWPRAEGQIPVYYSHKPTGRPAAGKGTTQYHEPFRSTYLDEPNAPLFAFGEGQSYTTYAYSDLTIENEIVSMDGVLQLSLTLTNTGKREGIEIVQLYVRDEVATVTRPVKELKGFQSIQLQAGESTRVNFELPIRSLSFHGFDNQPVIEPGRHTLWVGPNSMEGLEGKFEVTT